MFVRPNDVFIMYSVVALIVECMRFLVSVLETELLEVTDLYIGRGLRFVDSLRVETGVVCRLREERRLQEELVSVVASCV